VPSQPPAFGGWRRALLVCLAALALGSALRGAWLTADPPSHATVGIVWHDEGPWVHNARNKVLWNQWRTDEWNPVFLTPVFTGLEYAAFSAFGVGTWQARLVPVVSGLMAILLLAAGLGALAGPRAAAIGAVLLATNYVFVMWNRAALMESTMTAMIVAAWASYTIAERTPRLGLIAGAAVVAAWFTKASSAFFLAAIVLDCVTTICLSWMPALRTRARITEPSPSIVAAAYWTLAGLTLAGAAALVWFVVPYWHEYQFYNWQMSVVRKPAYTLRALLDRASWIPIVHDFFTRMWLVLVAAGISMIAIAARWRTATPGERLLVWWLLLGMAELVIHDSGNERRYVMFIPALVALAALLLGRDGPVLQGSSNEGRDARWLAIPVLLVLAYLITGSIIRLTSLYEVRAGVRLSALAALLCVALAVVRWRPLSEWLRRQELRPAHVAVLVGLAVAGDLAQYIQWAVSRTDENYQASRRLGEVLPPGTLVHGKLANGLSLENRIKPVFVGREFGNYADRKSRDDVRYILTYVAPRVGYEGSVINDVLDAYPNRTIIMTFDVAETATGRDRAALIDKFGETRTSTNGRETGRAHD
jgi:4-amino-4-deoxy-L-arabinose transferase-like glycosyltransferase